MQWPNVSGQFAGYPTRLIEISQIAHDHRRYKFIVTRQVDLTTTWS
jgi:hypothetical protein